MRTRRCVHNIHFWRQPTKFCWPLLSPISLFCPRPHTAAMVIFGRNRICPVFVSQHIHYYICTNRQMQNGLDCLECSRNTHIPHPHHTIYLFIIGHNTPKTLNGNRIIHAYAKVRLASVSAPCEINCMVFVPFNAGNNAMCDIHATLPQWQCVRFMLRSFSVLFTYTRATAVIIFIGIASPWPTNIVWN